MRKIGHVIIIGDSRFPLRIGFGFYTGLGPRSACVLIFAFQPRTLPPLRLDLGPASDPITLRVVVQLFRQGLCRGFGFWKTSGIDVKRPRQAETDESIPTRGDIPNMDTAHKYGLT